MGFVTGAITFRRYRIEGGVPSDMARTATVALRRYAFHEIDASRGERESWGWVNPLNLLGGSLVWEDLVDGHLVCLGVRRDRKTFSRDLFRARRDARIAEERRRLNVQRISRQQRLAIEEEVTLEMLSAASPTTQVMEVVWDLNTGDVLVGSASDAGDHVVDMFEATFDLRPRRVMATSSDENGDPVHHGDEFLTWLADHEGQFNPSSQVTFPGPLWMDCEAGAARQIAVRGEDALEAPEVRAGFAQGKRVVRAGLCLADGEAEWKLTLDQSLDVRGLRVPVPKCPDVHDGLLMRVQAVQHLMGQLDALFQLFLVLRSNDSAWAAYLRDRAGRMLVEDHDASCARMRRMRSPSA